MLLFIGQVGNDFVEREAFQEIDYRRMYGPLAKWVAQIDRAERIPEYVSTPSTSRSPAARARCVLALPEDMLSRRPPSPMRRVTARRGRAVARGHGGAASELLAGAKRPLVLVGGGGWTAQACEALRAFAERTGIPVGCAFRCQDLFDNRHPNYAGDVGIGINPKLAQRVKEADVLLVIGARLGEMTTSGYTLLDVPVPKQKLVHVHAGAEELGRVYQATLPINSSMKSSSPRLQRWSRGPAVERADQAAHADYLAWNRAVPMPGALHYGEVDRLAVAEPARRRDRHQRRRQFRQLAAPPSTATRRLAHAARADQRRDGLRRAGGGRGEDRAA